MRTAARPATAGEVRRLGAVFLAAACLLGALCAWKARHGGAWPWQAWAAIVFAAAGLACLGLGERARPIHRGWTALGDALGRIVSPVALAVLYFLVVTPFGLVFRLVRRDALGLRPDKRASTYWREPDERKSSRARMLRQY
jgi:hypothetical protein